MAYDILIVDDEPDIRLLIDGILRDEGYDTRGLAMPMRRWPPSACGVRRW